MPDLLDEILDHLVAQGVVRRPDTDGPEPPLWRQPADGAPAPGEKKGTANDDRTVLSAFRSGEIPREPGLGYSDRAIVDFWIRTKDARLVDDIRSQLSAEFAPPDFGIRTDWMMGDLYVIESRQWTGLAPLGSSRSQGFDFKVGYLFETRA